jgi:hypothetical protein
MASDGRRARLEYEYDHDFEEACCRYPPKIGKYGPEFPGTRSYDWCGEYIKQASEHGEAESRSSLIDTHPTAP